MELDRTARRTEFIPFGAFDKRNEFRSTTSTGGLDEDRGVPAHVTVSSEEGARWLDGGHSVDSVKMPREIFAWVGEWVEKNYRPKPFEKRIKPRSFLHPKDRV